MNALEVTDVWKSYGATPVLRGVSLSVADSSLTAILGASGAGKSTLLRVVAGFESADAGMVALGGALTDDGRRRVPPERRQIGYVPQDGALFPHLTVRANAAFALPRRERRGALVNEILRLVGLAGSARRYHRQLSGGPPRHREPAARHDRNGDPGRGAGPDRPRPARTPRPRADCGRAQIERAHQA